MNLDIFALKDSSGKMSKESYLEKNCIEEYEYILEYCKLNSIFDLPFKEKVYLCLNNLTEPLYCQNYKCQKKVKFKNSTLGYLKYCSNSCISSDPNIKKIKEQNSLKKWGTKSPTQSNIIKEKTAKTNKKKYGGNSPMSSKEVQNKSQKTLNDNRGVNNPAESKIILEKRIESFKNNIEQYKNSYRKTSLERYGVEHPWSNKDIHQKTIDFFYKSYKKRIIDSIKGDSEFKDFVMGDKTQLIFDCKKCGKEFEILTYQFYWRVNSDRALCTKCYPIFDTSSIAEKELVNFIKENYSGQIIENTKNEIKPYEIDIFLKSGFGKNIIQTETSVDF